MSVIRNDPFIPYEGDVGIFGFFGSVFRFLYRKTSVFTFCWPLRFPIFRFFSIQFFGKNVRLNPGQIAMWDSGFFIEVLQ